MEKSVMDFIKEAYGIFGKIAPVTATKILFKKYLGYKLDLNNPKTINEKMQYLKLYTYKDHPLITQCADKYAVREYVKKCGLDEILIPLLGVWDDADKIDFDILPQKFVLKCNHGSSTNIICTDKNELDIDYTRSQLKKWMKGEYGKKRVELIYRNINKKIIAEEYIETETGAAPFDYKIFCSYGEPKYVFVASGRGENLKFDFFSPDWKWFPATQEHRPNSGEGKLLCPSNWDKILEYASVLSKPFPLVRVDFYNENNRIIFGELTFLDASGLSPYEPMEYDRIFGDMIDTDIYNGIKE